MNPRNTIVNWKCIVILISLNLIVKAQSIMPLLGEIVKDAMQLNLSSEKQGIWIEKDSIYTIFGAYNNGKKTGVWVCSSDSFLYSISFFKEGVLKTNLDFKNSNTVLLDGYGNSKPEDPLCIKDSFAIDNRIVYKYSLADKDCFDALPRYLNLNINSIDGVSLSLYHDFDGDLILFLNISFGERESYIYYKKATSGKWRIQEVYSTFGGVLDGIHYLFLNETGILLSMMEYRKGYLNGISRFIDDENRIQSIKFLNGTVVDRKKAIKTKGAYRHFKISKDHFYPYLIIHYPRWGFFRSNKEPEDLYNGYRGSSGNREDFEKNTE